MNLSSYLQMPPAPLVPTITSNPVPQGTRAGAGPSAGASLGFDFAQVMARQMVRLAPQERQTVAADAPQPSQPAARTQDATPVDNRHATEQAEQAPPDTRDTRADDHAADTEARDETSAPTRQRSKGAAHKTQSAHDVDALLEGLMQGAPVTPAPASDAVAASAPAATQALTPLTAGETPAETVATSTLQTIELSPQMRIITDPQKAPSPESLAAFAKSMGLDESEIQNLLGQAPATPATGLASEQASTVTGLSAPTALQTAIGTALQGQGGAPALDSAVATQLAAMAHTAAQPTVDASATAAVSGAGLAAAATTLVAPTLPGLTATDMASIQQLQITVLPPAVLPVNTAVTTPPTPSTIEMLSLLGTGGTSEQDVSALLSRFSDDTGEQSPPDQQPSQGDGNHFSSFAQALNSSKNAANAGPANAAQTSAANMSDAYDQLSDKMATELAARMHKQLSDGEWKMKFGLRPSNLGGVEIQLEMKDGKLDAVFRADNPLTRDLLQNSSQRLREALGNFGINAGQVNVGQGGGNAQQNNSGNATKHSQVRDNSSSQVKSTGDAAGVTSARNKANASLLDLYA